MQNQRTILWVIFSISTLFLWDAWQKHNGQPSILASFGIKPPGQTAPPAASSTSGIPLPPNLPPNLPPQAAGSIPQPAKPGEIPQVAGGTSASPAVPAAATSASVGKIITIKNDVLSVEIDTVGGVIRQVELLKQKDTVDKTKNVVLLQNKPGNVFIAQDGFIGSATVAGVVQAFPNHTSLFTAADAVREASVTQPVAVQLTSEAGGLKVRKTITLKPSSYEIFVTHEVTNASEQVLNPQLYLQMTRDNGKPPGESQFYSTYTGPVVYTDVAKFQKVDFADIEKNKASYTKQSTDGWVGMIQHYFVTAWIPQDKATRDYFARKIDNNLFALSATQPLGALAVGASTKVESRLFVGPQDQKMLASVAPGLDLSVDYGILTVIAKPIYWLLDICFGLVKNWGWAIILLTFIIKMIFFPLQAFAYKSMAKMKTVGPKMKELQEKYGNDRLKLNQATMELYKTEKINPMGSCLPIFLQIPVFISLYYVLLASVEFRNSPWLGWIHDLAAPDPYYILPVILAITSFVQTKLNPAPPDPIQAKMMTIMPLVFSIMFFFFPAGLVLYWLANNIFSIAQQWYITRQIEGAAAAAKK